MNKAIQDRIITLLTAGTKLESRSAIEARYPSRKLVDGAEVTRLCPSPTGFMHIGTIFTGLICERAAHQSDGVYMLRIEDTDKKREVEGAKELIASQLHAFGLEPDEGLQADGSIRGDYGPYVQSERQDIYLAYAIDLLKKGRAYPCFATADELQVAVADQQAKKLRPGYYGEWALWRDRSDADMQAALDAGKPFVLRFRSEGSHQKRIEFDDVLKGRMNVPENDLDVPLIKSDEHRLPTYHLAHVVDDYLMRATIIMRGEEWLPSTPLHIELAQALGIEPFRYAHTPVISIIGSEGGKRKLSKRKDPQADVAFWLKAAYPKESIKAYLMGLANSNYEDWRKDNPDKPLDEFPFSLDKLASSRSPLLDMKKLEDYAKDDIAAMPQEHFNKEVLAWTQSHEHALYEAMMVDPEYTALVLAIERGGDKPRKDVSKWSDSVDQFGYFYDDIYALDVLPQALCNLDETVSTEDQATACAAFLDNYEHSADKDTWFENMKRAAEQAGYALDRKEMKANPDKYKGGLADFAGIIRVRLTGKTRTPDLWTIMQIMGEERVRSRLS
jgi:glutamyl-tRNA synthetase